MRWCSEWYQRFGWGLPCVHHWGNCGRWLLCGCRTVLWCYGVDLSYGTAKCAWCLVWGQRNACDHLGVWQILMRRCCFGKSVCAHCTWKWSHREHEEKTLPTTPHTSLLHLKNGILQWDKVHMVHIWLLHLSTPEDRQSRQFHSDWTFKDDIQYLVGFIFHSLPTTYYSCCLIYILMRQM